MVASWDWAYILYTGMVWLGYSEKDVWALTPRKWKALVNKHIELYKQQWGIADDVASVEHTTGYIDQVGI